MREKIKNTSKAKMFGNTMITLVSTAKFVGIMYITFSVAFG